MSEKLHKVLARTGLASRRAAEAWIAAGRVTVNGQVATPGDRVEADDDVRVDGRRAPVVAEEEMERRVIAYHKVEGEVVSRNDPEGRPSAFDALPPLRGQRWVSVGRLDINTSGLLLFTNDGELANRLMHPSTELEREYAVRVQGELTPEKRQAMLDGVLLEDGISRFNAITDAGGQGSSHWYRCSLVGGKYREVRRLWESQGYDVSRMVRIRFGSFAMTSALRQGTWVELGEDEIARLEQLCKLPAKKHTGLYGRARRLADRQERGGGAGNTGGGFGDSPGQGQAEDRPRKGGYLRGRR